MPSLWHALTRRKRNSTSPEGGDVGDASQLARVLNLFDLTALGVGSTLGLGAYVLAGSVAFEQAGPAVTLSFLVAAVASSFAGICYAEFAARVPKAGSAYVYSYITIGEFVAFTIGWNLILEYVIGTSSVARGLSGYIDSLIDDRMASSLRAMFPIDIDFMAAYPDFLSFVLVLLVAGLLSLGVKESSWMNIAFTAVNLSTIVVMIVAGSLRADPANWSIPKESIPADVINGGQGGFMPFGVAGVMAGAAKCFYGFVGFDCVATTGEEAKNPQRNIPISIVLSLIIICVSYLGVSTVLTMMTPYYMLNATAPFPHVFQLIGWVEIKWIVTIGAIFALCTNLLGAMFPLPRVLYAMASDGILYRPLKRIHSQTQTPLLATIVAGLLSATMALVFDLHQLIDMMSIGTLIAYTIVAICVLVLRFECDAISDRLEDGTLDDGWWPLAGRLVNAAGVKQTSQLSARIAKVTIVAFSATAIVFCALVNVLTRTENDADGGSVLGQLIGGALWSLGALMLLMVTLIAMQPVSSVKLMFRVPLVPWIPCLSVLINVYLMLQLDLQTWIRFGVWGAVGYFIYFTYGIRHSTEGVMVAKEKAAVNQRTEFYRINHITLKPTTVGAEHNGDY